MLNRDELKTVTAAITAADAAIGSVVPQNMRRFIYRVKWVNTVALANLFTLGMRENGAGATTVLDRAQLVVFGQMETDPDDLEEDALPLFIIDGPAQNFTIIPVGATTVRAFCGAGGTGFLTLWYIDVPA